MIISKWMRECWTKFKMSSFFHLHSDVFPDAPPLVATWGREHWTRKYMKLKKIKRNKQLECLQIVIQTYPKMLLKSCFPYNNKPTNSFSRILTWKKRVDSWMSKFGNNHSTFLQMSKVKVEVDCKTVVRACEARARELENRLFCSPSWKVFYCKYILLSILKTTAALWESKLMASATFWCATVVIRSHALGVYVERVLFFLQIKNTCWLLLCLRKWTFSLSKLSGSLYKSRMYRLDHSVRCFYAPFVTINRFRKCVCVHVLFLLGANTPVDFVHVMRRYNLSHLYLRKAVFFVIWVINIFICPSLFHKPCFSTLLHY